MTFYVQGRPEGETSAPLESSYLESASTWVKDKGHALSELSYDEAVEWSKDTAKDLWDRSVRAFKYLSGTPLPPPVLPEITADVLEPKKVDSVTWNFAGMFSSLKGPSSSRAEPTTRRLGRHFTEGEVHADLIKVNVLHLAGSPRFLTSRRTRMDTLFSGISLSTFQVSLFSHRSGHELILCTLGSRDQNPVRVFVEREPGVRENEPVMRWIS